ncbi:MAG: DNA polymerase III subunit epsilon [Gammaproteobacteria bacterium]|nr:DNA polymerase III subunit epsilon [Gammaproteobacteria bacterium]
MRQVVLDTETTGLEPEKGHRIIEIGCVEIIGRRLTERRFHCYLQPDREIDAGAVEVHGITTEFLADKPRFVDVVDEFLNFIRGSKLVIHNAAFDLGFINAELKRLQRDDPLIETHCDIVDTLAMARKLHPGQKNNLNALCQRYGIDNSQRALHGALLDAEILADLYLVMTGGQTSLLGLDAIETQVIAAEVVSATTRRLTGSLRVIKADAADLAAHELMLASLRKQAGSAVWDRYEPEESPE